MNDYATVGTMGSTRTYISALTKAILTQTTANGTNFDNMLTLIRNNSVNFAQGRTPAGSNPTSFSSRHYCWIHGRSFNNDHTSTKYEYPVEVHVPIAT